MIVFAGRRMTVTDIVRNGASIMVWATRNGVIAFRRRLLADRDYVDLARTSSGVCRAAVCEAHVRELAADKHVCSGHWLAWEKTA